MPYLMTWEFSITIMPSSVYNRHLRVCVLVRSAAAAMHPRRLSHMRTAAHGGSIWPILPPCCCRSHHRSNQRTSRPRWVEATSGRHQLKWLLPSKLALVVRGRGENRSGHGGEHRRLPGASASSV